MNTTLVQQKSPHDCVLACISMAVGKTWGDLWNDKDLEFCHKNRGIAREESFLARAGLTAGIDYMSLRAPFNSEDSAAFLKRMLWGRRALLSVHSLNFDKGHHMIYWDGEQVFDPSTKATYAFLHSVIVTELIIFKSKG